MMENFIQTQSKVMQTVQDGLKQHEENFKRYDTRMDQLATHMKSLENQIASQVSSSNFFQPGHFPSQPQNPREQAQAITLRSERNLPDVELKNKE